MATWLCKCGARNRFEYATCVRCSKPQPAQAQAPENTKPTYCPYEGAILESNGYCHAGGGWPLTTASQPVACSSCRRWLPWSGVCVRCTQPGDMPEGEHYQPIDGHWQRVNEPTRLFTDEQNKMALKVMQAVLEKRMTEEQGHAEIDRIASIEQVPF